MLVKLDHFPRDRGENKTCLKTPPPSSHLGFYCAVFFSASFATLFHRPVFQQPLTGNGSWDAHCACREWMVVMIFILRNFKFDRVPHNAACSSIIYPGLNIPWNAKTAFLAAKWINSYAEHISVSLSTLSISSAVVQLHQLRAISSRRGWGGSSLSRLQFLQTNISISIGWFQLNHVLAVNLEKLKKRKHFLKTISWKSFKPKHVILKNTISGMKGVNLRMEPYHKRGTHHRDPTEAKACGNQQVIWTWRLHPKPELLLMVKKSGEKNHLTCILSGIHDDPCMVYLILSYICLCFL